MNTSQIIEKQYNQTKKEDIQYPRDISPMKFDRKQSQFKSTEIDLTSTNRNIIENNMNLQQEQNLGRYISHEEQKLIPFNESEFPFDILTTQLKENVNTLEQKITPLEQSKFPFDLQIHDYIQKQQKKSEANVLYKNPRCEIDDLKINELKITKQNLIDQLKSPEFVSKTQIQPETLKESIQQIRSQDPTISKSQLDSLQKLSLTAEQVLQFKSLTTVNQVFDFYLKNVNFIPAKIFLDVFIPYHQKEREMYGEPPLTLEKEITMPIDESEVCRHYINTLTAMTDLKAIERMKKQNVQFSPQMDILSYKTQEDTEDASKQIILDGLFRFR